MPTNDIPDTRRESALASDVSREHVRWLSESYAPAIDHLPERKQFEIDIGRVIEPLYSPKSLADVGFDYVTDVGFPGEYPFTRGDSAAMFRTEPFVVSAYAGFGEATDCNKRFRKLIDLGVEQLLIAFDLPTQCGYDSDDVMSTGEVGRVGVSIDTLADMELLFEGIPLNSIKRVGTLGNSIGPIVLAMFAVVGEKQGLASSDYVINLQNDPLKEYLARGTQIIPAGPAAKLAVDPVVWCAEHAPGWSPITVCYNHLNAGGAGSTWGAALALGNAIHYLDLLVAQGHDIDKVAPLFHMFPDERHDFFVSVANLRALRRVWARLLKERYGARDPRSMALKTTVYGHGQEALQEPLNNIVRIGFGTLAYVLGGASYVYIASYDEAVGTPTEETVKVAVRTQQIIAHEHGFLDTIDPLGGSYFIETLTKQTADEIWEHIKRIDEIGGALRVIDGGFGREIMNRGAQRRQQRLDRGDRPWVTVNKWPQKPDVPNSAFRMDPTTTGRQHQRTARIRRERDNARVQQALDAIDRACVSGENMVPATMEAVRSYATVGEIAERWRHHFGTFEPAASF
ncbi:methylmalonyl-CoA mutase family protein [Aminobacter carboxidus]|uniref:Methylmalonyl-CoA mutase n=1 Tax=Aminobacter carboxidus TaxID=376165 RepID=A0ABR9GQV8_9HYPH|nr:methylmalonyl-CoA mutase family protein [Aminobacter carboxidus]MBE1206072.1 methylmalonyl-CoA mutase [Aminobacter carboxidus]